MKFPKMVRIRQTFNTNPVKDIPATVRSEINRIQPEKIIGKGESVAITAGSRGITNLALVLKEVVERLKETRLNTCA